MPSITPSKMPKSSYFPSSSKTTSKLLINVPSGKYLIVYFVVSVFSSKNLKASSIPAKITSFFLWKNCIVTITSGLNFLIISSAIKK